MKVTSLATAVLLILAFVFAAPAPVHAAPVHFKGKILDVAEGKMAIETADGNVITLYVSATSHFAEKGKTIALAQLRTNDTVEVDATQNAKGSFVIVEARLLARSEVDEEGGPPKMQRGARSASGSSGTRSTATLPPDSPDSSGTSDHRSSSARNSSDEGIPRQLKMPDNLPEYTAAERAAMGASGGGRAHSSDPKMELIERTRDTTGEFVQRLPNYVCSQYTTRYQSPGNTSWQALDVVSASLIYEDGHEDYRNIAINGRVQNKKMEELGGSTSTGEFGTILNSLFHPASQAKFKYLRESVTSRVTTAVYDFEVAKANSNWEIREDSGRKVLPAYRGTVWIDTSTARVLRIEMEALNMPSDFSIATVETAVDYDYVSLGTERYLLPTKSESISCFRGQAACARNVIEWRNYHKYLGESKITFDPK